MKWPFWLLLPVISFGQYQWSEIPQFSTALRFSSITLRHDDTLFAISASDSGQVVVKSGDEGKTWIETASIAPHYATQIFAYQNKLFLAGNVVRVSTDGGHSWSQVSGISDCGALAAMPNGDLFGVSISSGMMYKSTNAGSSWDTYYLEGVPYNSQYIKALVACQGYLVATFHASSSIESGLYVSLDSGKTFSKAQINMYGTGFYRYTGLVLGREDALFIFSSPFDYDLVFVFKSIDKGMTWSPIVHSGFSDFNTTGAVVHTKTRFLLAGTRLDSTRSGRLFESPDVTELISHSLPDKLLFWPNPAKDKLFIGSDPEIIESEVTNYHGQTLIISRGRALDVSRLSSGLYFLRLRLLNGETMNRRLLIER